MHAIASADELGIPEVIIPPAPSAFSAFGLVATDLKRDYARTLYADLGNVHPDRVAAAFAAMERAETAMLEGGQCHQTDRCLVRAADVRYRRQANEPPLPVDKGPVTQDTLDRLIAACHGKRVQTYGHANRDELVQLVNLRLTAIGKLPDLILAQPFDPSNAKVRTRDVWFPTIGFVETPVH